MKKAWVLAVEKLLSGIKHFVVPILVTWLVAGVAAGEIESIPLIAQTGMLLLCLSFYSAAAARTSGIGEESSFWLGLSRAGIEVEPMLITLGMVIIAVIGMVCGMSLGDEMGAGIGLGVAVLVCLAILTRVWPVFSVPFYFEGSQRWSPAGGGNVWSGPGLGRALRISRLPQARRMATPAFVIALLTLLLPLFAARFLWGSHFLLSLLFYAVALPYLSMLNFILTGMLLYHDYQQQGPGS